MPLLEEANRRGRERERESSWCGSRLPPWRGERERERCPSWRGYGREREREIWEGFGAPLWRFLVANCGLVSSTFIMKIGAFFPFIDEAWFLPHTWSNGQGSSP